MSQAVYVRLFPEDLDFIKKYTLKDLNELAENMKIQLNDKKYKKQELYDILKSNIEKTINL